MKDDFFQDETHPFLHQQQQSYQTSQIKQAEFFKQRDQQPTYYSVLWSLRSDSSSEANSQLLPHISCQITLRVESSIISININMIDQQGGHQHQQGGQSFIMIQVITNTK